ncbi:hypothetical protein NHX12_029798 [Muraenolepis orangiensis]|uniref:BHLH domain-containing protein n=1 Tax=Muraenolepis orangiensis TaxID=630683 RepID=A0A9Q0IL79_9TELE|nr:hypothetical protein NHX12_029798 [Muraenolepis orangiensis]
MAPTITSAMTSSKEHLTLTHKIRKPLVERIRRERINSSIEQLQSLLGPEFLKQEPDSKLEKADILEMTVDFVRQQQLYRHGNFCSSAANQGHSKCVKEMVHFLSKDELKTQSNRRLLDHFQNLQSSSDTRLTEAGSPQLSSPLQPSIIKEKRSVNNALWRPCEWRECGKPIRKPLVERIRRERINSSIEQLQSLLGPEFLKQEPDSKLEKADILEMTVDFVRQQQLYRHGNFCSSAANQGHSKCVKEMVHFLSKDELNTQSNRRLLDHFQNLQSSSDTRLTEAGSPQLSSPLQPSIIKEKRSVNNALWRPW